MRDFETFTGDIILEVMIVTTIINSVIFTFAVKLDKEFEIVKVVGQLMLLMSKTKFFSTKSANSFVTAEQEPRFDFGKAVDFYEGEYTATIVAANALRTHDDVAVSGSADVANRLFVNGVEMCDEHNGSLSMDKNKIVFVEQSVSLEFFGEPFEKLLLRGTKEIFIGVCRNPSQCSQRR